ncbi:hypothetical protein [Vibrio marisflavi]|uniref:Uncharacterized protein n=1 Tax=Vibrio marisflavi CECT 7928 TaxID=634439 RepID=A0ABN8E954_9VIBR|nr:hypothetical protein [Vibrio marisflavi]CAH0543160.1 hypothetical protein VMF7928_04430 [Vibrio marisflavi CECT 7928]
MSLKAMVIALRIFAITALLTLSLSLIGGVYSFYWLVLYPSVENQKIAMEVKRVEALSAVTCTPNQETSSNGTI